ncbi:MAG: diguanylate cyclase [Anaerolineae bacterium]|nr:diguanylate cyclase [Anaerolineae bacterium]
MKVYEWVKEFQGAVTVCNKEGIITEMNDKSISNFGKSGGADLIGSNVLECHPEPARSKLVSMLKEGRSNVYTIEKKGIKKLIYQAPVYENGEYAGFVELSLEIPFDMPHFKRD